MLMQFIKVMDFHTSNYSSKTWYVRDHYGKARYLCADALEQLGYQTITGLRRNMYLWAAFKKRHPEAASKHKIRYMDNKDVMPFVSSSLILDYIGINFDGEKTIDIEKVFAISIKNSEEFYIVNIYKGKVFHSKIEKSEIPDGVPVICLPNTDLYELATKKFENFILFFVATHQSFKLGIHMNEYLLTKINKIHKIYFDNNLHKHVQPKLMKSGLLIALILGWTKNDRWFPSLTAKLSVCVF